MRRYPLRPRLARMDHPGDKDQPLGIGLRRVEGPGVVHAGYLHPVADKRRFNLLPAVSPFGKVVFHPDIGPVLLPDKEVEVHPGQVPVGRVLPDTVNLVGIVGRRYCPPAPAGAYRGVGRQRPSPPPGSRKRAARPTARSKSAYRVRWFKESRLETTAPTVPNRSSSVHVLGEVEDIPGRTVPASPSPPPGIS